MALPSSSSDWSLPSSIHSPNTLNSNCKSHYSLTFPTKNLKIFIANSTGCSSPILELDPKSPNFQDFLLQGTGDSEDSNGLISTLFGDPQTEELALKYYETAKQNPGFKPEKTTLNRLIRYLIHSRNWDYILSLCEDLKTFNVLPDIFTCGGLVSFCVKARKFKIVHTLLEIFKNDQQIAVLAFDSAMKGYNKLHMYSSTIIVYDQMKSCGVSLSPNCYFHVMEAYMRIGDNEKILALFQELDYKGIRSSSQVYAKIYRILCESLGKSGRAKEALYYFRDMTQKGIPENHAIFSSLICSFVSSGEVQVAEELFKEAESKNMLRDPAVFLKLVLMYIEQGLLEKAMEIVSTMNRAKIKVSDCILCAIVNGYSKKRGLNSATTVYKSLISLGCEPGQVTYASVINIYNRLGLFKKAEEVFMEMESKGFDKCVVAYSNMVAMYGKIGRQRDAMRLVAKMKEKGCEPNVWIYNSLLDMHGRVPNLRQVEKVWKEMQRRKIVPDKVSYTSMVGAYCKAKEYEMCMKYYNEFRINGGVIDRAIAGIMVSVFSKTNRVDEVVKILQDMKAEGTRLDARLYRSALNALRDAGMEMQVKWMQQSFSMV